MAKIQFNSFAKKAKTKTSYGLEQGQPIFGETLYLVNPLYVHGRSPDFSLVYNSKHISSLYPHSTDRKTFTGDHKGKGILIFLRESGFDLFTTELSRVELVANLHTDAMVEALYKARRKVNQVAY